MLLADPKKAYLILSYCIQTPNLIIYTKRRPKLVFKSDQFETYEMIPR